MFTLAMNFVCYTRFKCGSIQLASKACKRKKKRITKNEKLTETEITLLYFIGYDLFMAVHFDLIVRLLFSFLSFFLLNS